MGKTSLKQVLKDFLGQFESMEKSRDSDHDQYVEQFQSLKELTESLRRNGDFQCSEGLKEVNRRKNRYKDILPYDKTRVVISEYPGVPGSDYINANYVRGSTGSSRAYICSQGPLPNTLFDFWRMIWECEVTVIVMACNESESGKYKCESYWPQSDSEQQYGNITVKLVKWRQVCPDFLVRTLEIRQENASRTVIQFHYSTWPDHGIPAAVTPILELVRLMRDVQATETRPILVHCSAGCGRTGTICSIDYVWALLRAGKLKSDFSLYSIIRDMRMQRIAMVQTLEQYMLCFKAVAALFQQQLKIIDTHTYENLDQHGEPLILRSLSSDSEQSSTESSARPNSDACSDSNCQTDVKTLINSWETTDTLIDTLNTIQRAPSLESLMSSSVKPQQLHIVRPDKLIGKATVIRRPSIAKLKAMFENLHSTDHPDHLHHHLPENAHEHNGHNTMLIEPTTRHKSKVKRSHSAKEISSSSASSRITIASRSTNVKLNKHLNSVQSTSSMATQAFSKSSTESSRRSSSPDESLSDSLAEEFDLNSASCRGTRVFKESINPTPLAPPKPPRTYQYGPLVPTPVNVTAQPNRYPNPPAATPSIIRPGGGTNEYIMSHQYMPLPQRLPYAISSIHPEPIYQPLIPRYTSQLQAHHPHAHHPHPHPHPHASAAQAIYGNIGFKRDIHLSVPNLMPANLLLAPSIPPRPSFYPSTPINGLPGGFVQRPIPTYEEIYENLPKKRPILVEKCSIRPSPPVTYVRPQPNPALNCEQQQHQQQQSQVTKSLIAHNEQQLQVISSTQQQQLNNNKQDKQQQQQQSNSKSPAFNKSTSKKSFSLSVFFGRGKKDANSQSASPASSTVSSVKSKKQQCKQQTIDISSANKSKGYKKSQHSRSVQNLTSDSHLQVTQANSSKTFFKPPHSHRFSPPTQWTQV